MLPPAQALESLSEGVYVWVWGWGWGVCIYMHACGIGTESPIPKSRAEIVRFPRDAILWFLRGMIHYNRARQHRVPSSRDKELNQVRKSPVFAVSASSGNGNVSAQACVDFTFAITRHSESIARYFRANALILLGTMHSSAHCSAAASHSWPGDAHHIKKAHKDLLEFIRVSVSLESPFAAKGTRASALPPSRSPNALAIWNSLSTASVLLCNEESTSHGALLS